MSRTRRAAAAGAGRRSTETVGTGAAETPHPFRSAAAESRRPSG